ncbi:MAG: glucokinase, partial [Methyloligellaceae bacterium]
RISGDLALASASWGGVFLCGGVIRGWNAGTDTALFREKFESKGAMKGRTERIFTGIITHDDVSLHGLKHLARRIQGPAPSQS